MSSSYQLSATQWKQRLAGYALPETRRSLGQLLVSLLLFALAISLAHAAHAVNWILGLPLSALAGLLIVRLFIIQHDCGHRSFFRDVRACDWVGQGLSVITCMPYGFWRRDHDKHHATSGDLDRRGYGDIDTLTIDEFRALGPWRRLAYRAYRNPLVLMGIGPAWQFLIRYRVPILAKSRSRRGDVLSILGHDAGLAVFFGGLCLMLGWTAVAVVWLPAMLVAATVGVWMFYVQHQHADTYWRRHADWSFVDAALQGSSYYSLPAWMHWLTGNIGYHHIHHLSSRIPNYQLSRAFADIDELRQGPAIGILESLRGVTLALWCERRSRLVSFREARRAFAARHPAIHGRETASSMP
jgi:omega-6 fatty acid desaturase (delta-12 desaturase)